MDESKRVDFFFHLLGRTEGTLGISKKSVEIDLSYDRSAKIYWKHHNLRKISFCTVTCNVCYAKLQN